MIIAAKYSFNGGQEKLEKEFPQHAKEIMECISQIDSSQCKTKVSKEKTMTDKVLYSPVALNSQFKQCLEPKGWHNKRIHCDYSDEHYVEGYDHKPIDNAFRDMDFVKDKVGVEVQFGKYAFMVYNVCAKMTIFSKHIGITVGVEIVPVKSLANEMSSGVSYFEQFVWDLKNRGVSNIDLPVFIVGIAA